GRGAVVLHDGGKGDGGGVGAAAAEGGDVVILVDALEAGDDDDVAVIERVPHALRGDILDAGLGVEAVGDDADLGAGEADGLFTERLDGHGHEGDGDLLASGQQHVHFTGGRLVADFLGQLDQFVGGVAARTNDDDDMIAGMLGADGPAGGTGDALGG